MKKNNFIYILLRELLTPLFKFWYNPKIINKKLIPKNGPFIICGNHLNFLDQFPVIISTKRVIHWMAKKEHFNSKFGFFFKYTGCISVDRNKHDGKSKIKAISYLKNNEAIGIFPEGTRNRTKKELLEFKKGAVRLAKELSVPIIPFAINGEYRFRSKNLIVRFGNPMYVGKDEDINLTNEKLRNTILELQKRNKKAYKLLRNIKFML